MDSNYQHNGYVYLDNLLSTQECDLLLSKIKTKINEWSQMHQIELSEYLKVVNRWPLDNFTQYDFTKKIVDRLNVILKEKVEIFEADVLYKSLYAPLPTPCHQDIAYACQKPYLCSTWIALTEVGMEESPVQFLPRSHLGLISPAVDFWQADFIDAMKTSAQWKSNAMTCPVKTGDGLLFSSKIWHASKEHTSFKERFSIVLRWGNNKNIKETIPRPIIHSFGMWNCGEVTQKLLAGSFEEWITKMKHEHEIVKALQDVSLLDNAYRSYRGGDSQGIVYKKLWNVLLRSLAIL